MIEDVNSNNIDDVLPLIRAYQEFYNIQNIDDINNKEFFSRFGLHSSEGCLFAYKSDNQYVAFATVYFSYASSIISKIAVMNDLYTLEAYRKKGIAKELIQHCEQYSTSMQAKRLQWLTAKDNQAAQSLYHALGAQQSSWEFFTYSQ